MTFTVVDTASGEAAYPKRAHLLFQDIKGEEDVTLPVTVKENGKAGFTIVSTEIRTSRKETDIGLRTRPSPHLPSYRAMVNSLSRSYCRPSTLLYRRWLTHSVIYLSHRPFFDPSLASDMICPLDKASRRSDLSRRFSTRSNQRTRPWDTPRV